MTKQASTKFKVGDIVVRTEVGLWNAGDKAEIIEEPSMSYPNDWCVRDLDDGNTYDWHESRFELESVYNSPLMKALR